MKVVLLVTVRNVDGSEVFEIRDMGDRDMADLYAVGDQLLLDDPRLNDLGPATIVLRRFMAAGETPCGPAVAKLYATVSRPWRSEQ